MKAMKRKLLSLLLAMAMVLTLAPTALAEGEGGGSDTGPTNPPVTNPTEPEPTDPEPEPTPDPKPELTRITITGSNSVDVGKTTKLDIKWEPTDAEKPTCTWSSNDESVATVSDGTVTGVSAGNTTITATVSGTNPEIKATHSITVSNVPVTGVSLNKDKMSLAVGASEKLTATVAPNTATNKNVFWKSDDNNVATVASDGTVEAKAEGTTTITVTTEDGAKTATCTVEVTKPVEKPTVTLSAPTPSTIYYSSNPSAVTKNIATTTMETTGDLTGYTLSWNISPKGYVTIAESSTTGTYAITANEVSKATTVSIQAVWSKTGSEQVTSKAVSLTVMPGNVYELNPSPDDALTINWNNLNLTSGYYSFSVSPEWVLNGVEQTITSTNVSYAWKLNNQSLVASSRSVSLSASDLSYGKNTLICTVTFKNVNGSVVDTKSATWTINMGYSSSILATATVATSTSSYALGDVDDEGKSSISKQLEDYFYNTKNGYYGLAYVTFDNVRDGNNGSLNATARSTLYYAERQGNGNSSKYLADVLFYPGTVKTTATFQATFYYYNNRNYQTASDISAVSGAITFNVVEDASSGDITYTASIGDDVPFALKDFEDFYYTKTRGTLNYVSFTLPSGGSLYADTGRLGSNNACYASPTRTQTDLAGVYFTPTGTTANRAGTVRVNFTAYGNRSTTSGTVAITYLNGSAKDITYSVSSTVSLKASDFTDAYRQAVGSTAPTSLTIQFQTAPANGTLTYKDSSRSNSSTVTLRTSNIQSYKFTTRTTGTNQLGDVTYTASGNKSDTIDYIAYVNNTPQFTGKVVFNGSNASASNMQVTFTSTNGQAVAFSYAEFSKANAATIAGTSYIRFVTMPTGGTLTYNGTVMSVSSTNVTPALLGSVVYRPNATFNNSTDRISFLCYDTNGNSVGGGQVSIIVTGNNSTGAATVNSFKDVSSTAWYRSDLITLVNAGIIQGRGDGKFDPTAELTYGEALKIFLMASGYPAQQEPSGKNWAVNYKNLAVSNGWISDSIDLSAKISRNNMAELAAKSLGISPNSTVPPTWKDGTSNSYANALYYTNPQILIGNADGTFKGNDTLKRQEICAIASRVLTYRSNQQAEVKPGWIG